MDTPTTTKTSTQHSQTEFRITASKRNLGIAFLLIVSFMVAEIVGGILSGSLALLADAAHMATDAGAILLALIAINIAQKSATSSHTYGYKRLEILAALVNVLALWVIVGGILFEAWNRFNDISDVDGRLMLIIGVLGLIVNICAAWILRHSAEKSLNVEGAFQHVLADLLGSIGVVVSGCLIWAFDWNFVDPIISVIIAILIIHASWGLFSKVVHVLLEGVPKHINIEELCSKIEAINGVHSLHDVHVWTLTLGNEAFTCHVLLDPSFDGERDVILHEIRTLLRTTYDIEHITVQIERSMDECPESSASVSFLQPNKVLPS